MLHVSLFLLQSPLIFSKDKHSVPWLSNSERTVGCSFVMSCTATRWGMWSVLSDLPPGTRQDDSAEFHVTWWRGGTCAKVSGIASIMNHFTRRGRTHFGIWEIVQNAPEVCPWHVQPACVSFYKRFPHWEAVYW